jgi:hypothetical protein
MKVLLASFEPRRDKDPDRLTLRSKANPHREQQAVIEPADQDPRTLRADAQRPRQHPSGSYERSLNHFGAAPIGSDLALTLDRWRWCGLDG